MILLKWALVQEQLKLLQLMIKMITPAVKGIILSLLISLLKMVSLTIKVESFKEWKGSIAESTYKKN